MDTRSVDCCTQYRAVGVMMQACWKLRRHWGRWLTSSHLARQAVPLRVVLIQKFPGPEKGASAITEKCCMAGVGGEKWIRICCGTASLTAAPLLSSPASAVSVAAAAHPSTLSTLELLLSPCCLVLSQQRSHPSP